MSASPNSSFVIQRQAALTNTPVLLRAGLTDLWGWNIINKNAAIEFVQLFNAATAGAVTLGTTVPNYVIQLTTGVDVATVLNLNQDMRISFPLGLVVACTTTETGSTAPATNPVNCYFLIN